MHNSIRLLMKTICLFLSIWSISVIAGTSAKVPILTYHNFNPTVPGSMSITPARFESQLKWLKDNGFTVIPLKDLVSYLQGKEIKLPAKSVVITADDGWESVYTYMMPLVKKYQIPVTLFIYPSTISHGVHAMTWNQLKELQKTGLFDIQGHTYWHPNFKQEKKHLSEEAYQKLVHVQLFNSKKILEDKLQTKVTLVAWPFGIYDSYLEQEAENAGYIMAFSIDDRRASKAEKLMAEPRYMIVAGQSDKRFASILNGSSKKVITVSN
ncbi:MAG: polysaccharide deacetylase family protein [Gammaproteobacteria bacterium]